MNKVAVVAAERRRMDERMRWRRQRIKQRAFVTRQARQCLVFVLMAGLSCTGIINKNYVD